MRFLVTAISLCFAFASVAQTNKRVLTFEEAIKIALKNSVLLNQQRNNLELSQAQKTSSLAGIGPNVSVNLTASQFNGNSFNQNAGVVVNGIRDNISGSFNASMNLFNGFSQLNTVRQASSNVEAQANFVARTEQDVINTVSTQYLQVMLDVELLRIAQENLEALSKQLEQTKEQVAVGARSPVDEHNQNALTKGAELRFVQAEIALQNDKALLAQTLLIDAFEDFDVDRPTWDTNTIGSEAVDPMALAETAKQFRGDYQRAVKAETAQQYAMRAAKGAMAPSLSAFFVYGSAYNFQEGQPDSTLNTFSRQRIVVDGTEPSGYALETINTQAWQRTPEQRSFNDQFRLDNIYKQYGVQLNIPIFNGFQNRVAYAQQKIQYQNSKLNTKNLEFQIRNDVMRAARNYDGAKKAFSVAVSQWESAQVAFNLEQERYNLGVTNFVDFTNANRALVQAQTDKAQAEYRLLFQKIVLDYAVGTLRFEDIP